jgi:hypothetical protein
MSGDTVYGCGLAGLILRGSGSQWEVLDQDAFDLDLYSICVHDDRVYVASLYELKQDQKLHDLNYGISPPKTAHTLCSLPDGLAG